MATEILALTVRTTNLLDEAKWLATCASWAAAGADEYDATPIKIVTDLAVEKINAASDLLLQIRDGEPEEAPRA